MTENEKQQHGFVEQDTALESMRASDFDCYSAYGEVIDNSIQANATKIWIDFIPQSRKPNDIKSVVFADNGTGMDSDLLHKCLKLGHSSRYNNREGIGRFGVGMTLGAIHECRKVEVYSKVSGGSWKYTYLDLDEIKNGQLKYLPVPQVKEPPQKYTELIDDSGTIVIWDKYDKQVFKLPEIIKESRFWIGRTFRKFIWGEANGYETVEIKLDDKLVLAFDPLFYTKKNTGFENEEKSSLTKPQKFNWSIPKEAASKKQQSEIILNVSLLPDSYRRKRGQGGDEFAKERYIDRNEGISILRNDREVFYGHIPHATKLRGSNESDRNVSRFIGCEICFNAELDTEFAVKHIKRGAVPIKNLKIEIIKRLAPTFKTMRDKIRDRWNEIDRIDADVIDEQNDEIGISSLHNDTNKLLKDLKPQILKGDKVGKNNDSERIVNILAPDASQDKRKNVIDVLKSNGITIDEREFFGNNFLDIEHGNGFKTLFYNTNSVFYKEYKSILEEIFEKNKEVAKDYRVLMDLIFVGYMTAESKIDPNESIDGATFMDELKSNWANDLARMLKRWKK